MTSQVEFFCTAQEEATVLEYLAARGAVFSDVTEGSVLEWQTLEQVRDLPTDQPMTLMVWVRAHGPLVWHKSKPQVSGETHESLVMSVFARKEWEEQQLGTGDRVLDTDASPVLHFERPYRKRGLLAPRIIVAPPSSIERVGVEYARWVRRVLSWVRRRGKIVHDWRSPSKVIPNPLSLLSTIYAWPGVRAELEERPGDFVII